MERWRAGGRVRCAVFASRALSIGDELTFDYQWGRHSDRQKTKCLCGTPTCRGFIEVEDLAYEAVRTRANLFCHQYTVRPMLQAHVLMTERHLVLSLARGCLLHHQTGGFTQKVSQPFCALSFFVDCITCSHPQALAAVAAEYASKVNSIPFLSRHIGVIVVASCM